MRIQPRPLLILRAACVFGILFAATALRADDSLFQLGQRLHSDETFKQEFVGSFAPLSNREPELTELEGALLTKMADMFEVNTAYAQTMLETVLKDDTKVSATFNFILANLYFANDDYLLAEQEYRKAIGKYPNFQRAWSNLGALYLRGDDPRAALDAFSKSIELGDVSPSSYGKLAYCHYALGHYMSAEAAYTLAIMRDPNNRMWLEGKVEVYMDSKRFPEAIGMIDELIAIQPTRQQYWLAQSNAYLATNDYQQAAGAIEVARRLGDLEPGALYQLGSLYARLGLGDVAAERLQEALAKDRNPPWDRIVNAALALQNQDDLANASRLLELVRSRASESVASDPQFLRLRAGIAEANENWDQAIAAWNDLIAANPTNGSNIVHLAKLQRDHGQRERAYLLADRVTSDDPAYFDAQLLKAQLLVGDERYQDAIQPMNTALQIRSSESLQNLLTRIKQAAELRETSS